MKLQQFKSNCLKIRSTIIDMIAVNNRGHYGSAMSLVEILVFLYQEYLKIDSKNHQLEDRDRLILSKGHGCLALYAVLKNRGFINKKDLLTFSKFDSLLAGHPERSIPGIETSTGSLGHGLSIGVGMAIGLKLKKIKSKVIVIMGDGEINEGSVWEAALHASKHQLDNLIVIIDYNKIQSYGSTKEVCNLEPLAKKWESFGFKVSQFDGHNYKEISKSFKSKNFTKKKPHLFISHSIKGKGFFKSENNPEWHHKRFNNNEIKELKKIFNR